VRIRGSCVWIRDVPIPITFFEEEDLLQGYSSRSIHPFQEESSPLGLLASCQKDGHVASSSLVVTHEIKERHGMGLTWKAKERGRPHRFDCSSSSL